MMLAQSEGAIVNISKFGVRAFCVHPGGIRTSIEKSGRRCSASGEEEARFSMLADKLLRTAAEDCAAAIRSAVSRISPAKHWFAHWRMSAAPRRRSASPITPA
jgi:NAD(P)-dependent dehydrogenase (short-subunit alcohol dehydrogenase family)